MSTDNTPLIERVQTSYKRLTTVASDLNTASDELGRVVAALDEALKKLNLGITSWHRFVGRDDGSSYWGRYIGYAKIGSKWGIALSRTSGYHGAPPEDCEDEEWLFNDAPRQLRMEAVEHIPAMIEKLLGDAEKAIEKIKTTTAEAQQLAEALAPPPAAPRRR